MAISSSVPPSDSHLFRVFIDSSLDTHLTMDISSSDTVSALKGMIEIEHPVCFPDIGQIIVRSVKVKRNGQLYNMVNSMLIISPFETVQRPIFLKIEVEAVQIPNDQNFAINQNEANAVLERGDLEVSYLPSLERGESMDFSPNLPRAHETLTDPNPMERLQNEIDGANRVETDANPIEKSQNEKDNANPVEAQTTSNIIEHNEDIEKNPIEKKKKRKTAEASSDKNHLVTDQSNEAEKIIPDTNIGAETQEKVTHKSKGKKSKKENVSENPGDRNSLAPNEIITDKNAESRKKAPTDQTVTSQAHMSPYKKRSKKAKAVTADVAANNDDVADDKDAGQIISSILADLKDQGPSASENQADGKIESQTLANADVAPDHPNPNPEPKTKPKLQILSTETSESLQNITPNEKKKRKKAKVFTAPLLAGNENTQNPENFETLAVVISQQESERIGTKLDSNSIEDTSKQEKKKKRRKTEAKSTAEKKSDETVNNAQIDVTKPSETETLKSPKKKSAKLKSKEKSVNNEKSEGQNSKNVSETEARRSTIAHNLNTDKINFIDYFSPDEPKKRLKDPNPNFVDDLAYLSDDSTQDENDAKNEAKRYKVAVRKVPVKRKNGEKNKLDASKKNFAVSNDNASESTKDEGSFMSDAASEIKKGGEGKSKIGEGSQSVDIVYETEEQDLI